MARSGSNQRQKKSVLNVRMEPDLKAAIEKASGDKAASTWLRDLAISALNEKGISITSPAEKPHPKQRKIPANASVELAEAARAVVSHSFTTMGVQRVFAECRPENIGSIRVLEKLGMTREGRLRQNRSFKGRVWDTLIFGLLRDEWRAAAT